MSGSDDLFTEEPKAICEVADNEEHRPFMLEGKLTFPRSFAVLFCASSRRRLPAERAPGFTTKHDETLTGMLGGVIERAMLAEIARCVEVAKP